MATSKAERLLNLVIALLNAPRYRTASWIREKVAGYGDVSEETFLRTFERDKYELRELGIPVQTQEDPNWDGTGSDDAGTVGYRIPPGEFALPPLTFSPQEMTAIGLAARLWEATALSEAGSAALRKLRETAPSGTDLDRAGAEAGGLLVPRVRTNDPAFAPVYQAIRSRRATAFEYRKGADTRSEPRSVQPWGLVNHRGRWYLVGHDNDRGARRTFRLSRVAGEVRIVGRSGAVRVPENLNLLALVAAERPGPDRPAVLRVREGRAAGLRRLATSVHTGCRNPDCTGWDKATIPIGNTWDLARQIAAAGPDAQVLEPPELRDRVLDVLKGAAT